MLLNCMETLSLDYQTHTCIFLPKIACIETLPLDYWNRLRPTSIKNWVATYLNTKILISMHPKNKKISFWRK